MKIQIGFLNQPKAVVEANGNGPLLWSSPDPNGIHEAKQIVDYYARGGIGQQPLIGEALLQTLVTRLSGRWWAVVVN